MGGPQTAAVLLWNSALILVDHIHFQYNGMMLGLLLLSAAAIEKGQIYLGALLFCLLLCMKHIFLYVAPVYFVYLLRGHCGASCWPPRLLLGNLIKLGAVVLSAILVLMSPFLSLQQLEQIAQRLFPFGRGLTHAYWAPNCWALYNTFDRASGPSSAKCRTRDCNEQRDLLFLFTAPNLSRFLPKSWAQQVLLHQPQALLRSTSLLCCGPFRHEPRASAAGTAQEDLEWQARTFCAPI